MLRLTKETDYGIALLTVLARPETPALLSARDLAERTHIPSAMVGKILKRLVQKGILDSVRGANGGYRLARSPERISLMEIVEAMEGGVAMAECIATPGDCVQESVCCIRPHLWQINRVVRQALGRVSLAQLAEPAPTAVLQLERFESESSVNCPS